MQSIVEWFLWLYEAYGINLSIIYDAYDRSRFIEAMWTTLWLSAVSVFFSLVIGIIGAWLQGSRLRILRMFVQAYIQFFRNTPPLIQMVFFYFGLGALMPTVADGFGGQTPIMTNFHWAVVSLSFFGGSFNVEIFRSGVEAVPKSTIEAAEALGYSSFKAYIYVVLPLAFRICLPALNSNLVNLVKTTTLAYAIAVPEMVYVCAQIWSDESNVPEMMNVMLIFYLLLVGLLVWIVSRWEKSVKIPGYSA